MRRIPVDELSIRADALIEAERRFEHAPAVRCRTAAAVSEFQEAAVLGLPRKIQFRHVGIAHLIAGSDEQSRMRKNVKPIIFGSPLLLVHIMKLKLKVVEGFIDRLEPFKYPHGCRNAA